MDALHTAIRLLHHQWLASFRTVVRPQNVAGTVVLAVLVVVLALNLLSLGLFLDGFLASLGPGVDPVGVVNSAILYYVLLDLLLRLWFQRIPGQIVRPYLVLPVRRTLLVRLVLTKSLFSLFNVLPLLLFVPVAGRIIAPSWGVEAAAAWIVFVFLFLLSNGMAILYVKKRELAHPWWSAAALGVLTLVAVLEYTQALSLREVSVLVFRSVIEESWWVAVPLLVFIVLYRGNYALLVGHLTLEDLRKARRSVSGRVSFGALQQMGDTGRLIALELKMLIRNKRPRASLVFSAAMIPFLIAFEAYWLEQMPDRSEIYPIPDSLALVRDVGESLGTPAGAKLRQVAITLTPRTLPEGTWIHLTGNLPVLGEWDPAAVPLLPKGDGTWQRTLLVPADTLVEFRFTLGSWDTQRLEADGSRSAKLVLRAENDTTLSVVAEQWRFPVVFVLITVNMIYIGILLSGMFLLSYGQLLLGWEGSYFEGILARSVSLHQYIAAKYCILLGSVLVSFLLTLPLGMLKPWFVPANGALALYNAGVNAIILLVMAQFSRKPVDLDASVFSMQGKGSVQILLLAPVLLGPLLIYAGCALLGVEGWTFWILGGLGLLALFAHRWLLMMVVRMISSKKHTIVAAYRLA